MQTAFLLLCHGTRDDEGVAEFHRFCDLAAEYLQRHAIRYGMPAEELSVGCAFLELCDPDLPSALTSCADSGAERIVLVPLLLFAAGHAKQDVPVLVEQARRAGLQVPVDVLSPMCRDEAFIEVAAEHVRRVGAADGCGMLFVGRGGSDALARADALAVAESVAMRAGVAEWAPAFLAGPGPDVTESVRVLLAQGGLTRLVVLPYLWFTGRLLQALPDQVQAAIPQGRPSAVAEAVTVSVASHLGCDTRLVARVAERALAFAGGTRARAGAAGG